jgi:hypothetical protein
MATPLFTKEEIRALAGALGSLRQRNPKGGGAFDVVKGLLHMIPESEREKADKLYEMWNERQPTSDIVTKIVWPENQVVVGKGRKIGYTSDKWLRPNKRRDYIHDFDTKHPPKVIMEYDASNPLAQVGSRLKKPIKPPKHPILVGLGHALDVEFVANGQIQQIDWKGGSLPWLLIDTQRNLLIIQQEDGRSPAVILDSPVVEITARGIEN